MIQGKGYKLYNVNMLDMCEHIQPDSIDSIVTDPPYELNFMNKGWDNSGIAFQTDTWKKCYNVLKPGGFLLAFGSSRTYHRIACAIEDAGFEVRDTIMWLYGSGFPKSMDLGKSIESKVPQEGLKWNGWGTALKPSYEPIIVARKPCDGSCTENVIKYGVGGINIEECRVSENGRFPSNTILTYDDTDQEEVCGNMPVGKKNGSITDPNKLNTLGKNVYGVYNGNKPLWNAYNDSGSTSRYFYCAKATKRDRDEGLETFENKPVARSNQAQAELRRGNECTRDGVHHLVYHKNTHPTVKPTSLMQYLVRLVTPKGGTVLDPFNGSGSTGKAVMYENKDRQADYKYIGFELSEEYITISAARMDYVISEPQEEESGTQMTISEYFAGVGTE